MFPEGDAYKIPAPPEVLTGSELWITRRMKTERKAAAIMAQKPPGKIPVDMTVHVNEEGFLTLTGGGAAAVSETPVVPAETRPMSRENLEVQLRKTGGTPFVIRNLTMQYDGTKFLPVGAVNELRRKFLAGCKGQIDAGTCGRVTRPYLPKAGVTPEKTRPVIQVYTDSVVCAKAAHAAGAGQIVYEGPEEIYDIPVIYKLPRILHQNELETALAKIPASAKGVMADGAGIAGMIRGFQKYGGPGLNIMNARAAIVYGKSCRQVCLSPELSGKEIQVLMSCLSAYSHPPKTEVLVQGNLEVMISRNCIPATAMGCRSCSQAWALRDATGRVFRVRTDRAHRSRILNAAEICLISYADRLASAGIAVFSIDARGRSPEYIRRMTAAYTAALDGENVKELKEEIRAIASGGITAAHYLRGAE
jgi:putative protease